MDTNQTILAVVIVIALSVGAYFLFIKKSDPTPEDVVKAAVNSAGAIGKGLGEAVGQMEKGIKAGQE